MLNDVVTLSMVFILYVVLFAARFNHKRCIHEMDGNLPDYYRESGTG